MAFVVALAAPAAAAEPEAVPLAGGPALSSLAADPVQVDVSDAAAPVAVSARLADPEGVASAALRLGIDGAAVPLALASGTAADGVWSGVASVPAFTPHGAVAAYVSALDSTGAASAPVVEVALSVVDAVPAAPGRVAATADAPGTLQVSWAAPPANGGSPVESYGVTAVPAVGSSAAAVVPAPAAVSADATSVTLTGLSSGTRYVVGVAARNAVGAGAAATVDAVADPGATTVPDAPTAVTTAPGNRSLAVSWTPPASTGGVALTAFSVALAPRGAAPVPPVVTVAPAATTATVDGLVNGETYDVSVTAVNAVGAGLAGTAVGTPRTVPGAPALSTLVTGNASAVVTWTAPASDGGAAVTSYVVTARPSGVVVTVPGDTLRAMVAGLPNGVAATFTVAAVNAAGAGPASAASAPVTPRQPGRLVVTAQPDQEIVYGTATTVSASLVTSTGTGIPGQRVELLARVRPSTTWRSVAAATTGSTGKVTLRATLPATAALRLHHPLSAVTAGDTEVKPVYVASRVSAAPSAGRIRLGMTLTVRGNVAPAHPAGSTVRLQRYVGGSWQTIGSGRMTTTTAYRITWKPGAVGSYPMRVVKPADADHATGKSAAWRQYVDPENAADLARAIYANARVKLETTHDSGVFDLAHARQNIVDVAAGRLARRSAYQNAPGGYTRLDRRLLRALRRMGVVGRVTVSEIAGGSHSRGSAHYYGRGLDISWVNGVHVARGSNYRLAVDICRAYGAANIYHPSYDPHGGHQRHVHCDWS